MKAKNRYKNEREYNIPKVSIRTYEMLLKMPVLQNIRAIFYFIDGFILQFIKKPQKDGQLHKKSVLVIHNIALGDSVLWLSVSKQLRELYPRNQYTITLACQQAFKPLYDHENIFDDYIFISNVSNVPIRYTMYKKIRNRYFDLILDPVGCENCTTNIFIARAAVGGHKIGILDKTIKRLQCPGWMRKRIYDKVIEINTPNLHLTEYYAEFIKGLGHSEFVAVPAALTPIEHHLNLPDRYFIIFPTASIAIKRWPLERFAELTKRIYEKTRLPLLLCGTSHDKSIVDQFIQMIPDVPVVNFLGKTNILEFIEVIRNAAFIVTNDTSAYHIAVSTKTPVGLICGGYTYNRYAKYPLQDNYCPKPVLIENKMNCFNCNNHCRYPNANVFPCIDSITVENAWDSIQNMIKQR